MGEVRKIEEIRIDERRRIEKSKRWWKQKMYKRVGWFLLGSSASIKNEASTTRKVRVNLLRKLYQQRFRKKSKINAIKRNKKRKGKERKEMEWKGK